MIICFPGRRDGYEDDDEGDQLTMFAAITYAQDKQLKEREILRPTDRASERATEVVCLPQPGCLSDCLPGCQVSRKGLGMLG